MKMILIVVVSVFGLCLQTASCNRADEKWVKVSGPNDPASVVLFFKKDTTYEQREAFDKTILSYPHPEGKGYYLQPGIASTLYVRNSDYEGYAIQFSTDATSEQRERLKRSIRESPIVYKVYENVIPSQIRDLHSNDKWVEMGGPTKNTNLVLFFNKGVGHEQIEEFKRNVLSKESPYGPNTGRDLPDAVAADFRVLNCSYEGVGINFSIDATPEQREALKKQIRESQVVFRVYENVVPSEIKDLCSETSSPNAVQKGPVKMSSPK